MTLKEHNRTALAIARAEVFFDAFALPQSPSVNQLQQVTATSVKQERFSDSRRVK